jgi:beta-N-acetylhexosaminidase
MCARLVRVTALVCAVAIGFIAAGEASAERASEVPRPEVRAAIPPTAAEAPREAAALGGPSLSAMIGQMILIGFPGTRPDEALPARVVRLIHDGRIGGVVLYDYNIVGPRQVKALNGAFRDAGGLLRPFICVDQEGGTVQRLTRAKGFVGLPGASRIAGMNLDKAYALDADAARELAGLGFNVNFGPVVDLNLYPANPVIGRLGRSFGADPDIVIEYASEFISAHTQSGVLTVAKHFPGHGSARTDPHQRIVDISQTWSPSELIPYQTLIGDGAVDMVMVGHLIAPDFSDGGNVPASLSRRAIAGRLRGDLQFKGLVVTDDLDMGAISSRYPIEEAAVMAIAAGADLIIANHGDIDIADRIIAAVTRAVADGRVSRQRIEEAYQRILSQKLRLAYPPAYAWNGETP